MKGGKVISYEMGGSSMPVVIRESAKKYLVKLRKGGSGEFALLNEWIGNKVGRFIGLNTQNPIWITLTNEIEFNKDLHIEVRELVSQSLGSNLAFLYLENIEVLNSIRKEDTKPLTDAFLLDIVMINIDRTPSNTNLFKVDDKIIVADFDSSLLISEIINNCELLDDVRVLECLKRNPLYQSKIPEKDVALFLAKMNKVPFEEILSEVPIAILDVESRRRLLDGLKDKISVDWNILATLKHLETAPIESKADIRFRTRQNRESFEEAMKKREVKK